MDEQEAPPAQFLAPDRVMTEMAAVGSRRVAERSVAEVLVLSTVAGGLLTTGALLSILLATGASSEGTTRLLEGVGFSVGFFAVILSGTLLFTEVNVEMPATLLGGESADLGRQVLRLWVLAAIGNMAGAVLAGLAINAAETFSPATRELLAEVVESKMRYRDVGGLRGVWQAVLSGVLGNWLVGMAAFLSVMGRTIVGKFIPVLLLVTTFVAAGFLHSPANMAYVSLAQFDGLGPGWGPGLSWAIAPAAVGNVVGAFVLVALPFWFVTAREQRRDRDREGAT